MRYLHARLLITTAIAFNYQAYGACIPAPTINNDQIECDASTIGDIDALIGNDIIEIFGANMGVVLGEEYASGIGLIGDNDRILIKGKADVDEVIGESFSAGNNRGGDDYINIANATVRDVTGEIMTGDKNIGGNDEIFVSNKASINTIEGDDFLLGGSNNRGGNDKITVTGGSRVEVIVGDVFSGGDNNRGGYDLITVNDASVGTISGESFNGGTGHIGGNDTIRLTSAEITGNIVLNTGSDTVKFFDLGSKISGVIDGGDSSSSQDGYTDTIEIIGVQGSFLEFEAMVPSLENFQNFENFALLRRAQITAESGYVSPIYEKFIIDESSAFIGSGGADYIINANLYHDGLIDLSNGTASNRLFVAGSLTGKGVYSFDVDFAQALADRIIVNGKIQDSGYINVMGIAGDNTANYNNITLIEAPNDADKSDEDFNIAPEQQYGNYSKIGRFPNSPYLWRLQPLGNDWVLSLATELRPIDPIKPVEPVDPIDPTIPIIPVEPIDPDPVDPQEPIDPTLPPRPPILPEIPAYVSLPTIGLEVASNEVDTLHTRLGEIRNNKGWIGSGPSNLKTHLGSPWHNLIAFDESKANMWVKGNINHFTFGADNSFGFSGNYGGITAGIDKKFDISQHPSWHIYTGVFTGYKTGSFETSGEGKEYIAFEKADIDIDTWSIGAYASFFSSAGSYIDLVLEYIDLNAITEGAGLKTSSSGHGLSGSIEIGHSFDLAASWIIEPQAQMKLIHVNWDDFYDGVNQVSFDEHIYAIGRAGIRIEKTFKIKDAEVKPWGYMGVSHEWSGTPKITYAHIDFKGQDYHTATEAKLGLTTNIHKNFQLYTDGGYFSDFENYEGFRGHLGMRWSW